VSFISLALIAILLSGCGQSQGPRQVGSDNLEEAARQALADKSDKDLSSIPSVSCPNPLPAKKSAKTRCSLGPDSAGKSYWLYISVSKAKGERVEFDVRSGSEITKTTKPQTQAKPSANSVKPPQSTNNSSVSSQKQKSSSTSKK